VINDSGFAKKNRTVPFSPFSLSMDVGVQARGSVNDIGLTKALCFCISFPGGRMTGGRHERNCLSDVSGPDEIDCAGDRMLVWLKSN
jgi:hypothetical protein